jgi:hypothetical protein
MKSFYLLFALWLLALSLCFALLAWGMQALYAYGHCAPLQYCGEDEPRE